MTLSNICEVDRARSVRCLLYPIRSRKRSVWISLDWAKKIQALAKTLIAQYKKEKDSDGQDVNVYCEAGPARFYIIEVLLGFDSCGNMRPSYTVSTGSGMDELSAKLAEAISEGMVGFYANGEEKHEKTDKTNNEECRNIELE